MTKHSSHYLYSLRKCHSEAVSIPTSGFDRSKVVSKVKLT